MKNWLYYIINELGKSYTVQNGIVKTIGTPTPLENTPEGWQDITIAWERNLQKVGLVRNFSLPLSFVRDAAQILRHIFFTKPVDEKIYLLIQQLDLEIDNSTFKHIYRYFYKGELDLTTTNIEEVMAKVSIMEGGLSKFVKANEGTTYEFPVADDSDAVLVKMNGLKFANSSKFAGFEYTLTGPLGLYVPDLVHINSDGNSPYLSPVGTINGVIPSGQLAESLLYFISITNDLTITFKGFFDLDVSNVFLISITNQSESIYVNLYQNPGLAQSGRKRIDYDETLNFLAGDKLFLVITRGSIITSETTLYDYELTASYEYTYKTTYVKAYPANVIYKKCIAKITGDENYAKSDYLQTKKHFCITSGDALRGIAGAKLKTSLNDLVSSYNVPLNIGIGIENKKVAVEQKAHFLTVNNPIALGNCKELKVTYATDLAFSSLKIGYPEVNMEDVNGKYSFNNSHIYTGPNTKVSKQLEIMSKYKADPYEIEITRINFEGKTTTDNSNDNTVYFLDVDLDNPQTLAEETDGYPAGTTYYNLYRETYDSTEGIYDPATIFNVRLSPKRCLYAHGNWLRACNYLFENKKLVFQSTEKNAGVKTVKGTEVIDENADVLISELDAPLFKPYYLEFENEVPADIVEELETDSNRPFSTVWNDDEYAGINIKCAISANDKKTQVFKLLSSPNNDLTQLI